ncbi:MAG: substrate-binding domain-containing protein, partial [Parasporobacterium sp.]|nr:substrate-binding domain-containing protein [Parasporobacterium sp.]
QDDISTLTIAAVDAVNTYTYTSLYDTLVRNHPLLKLNIRTHHSNEIHGLVENRTADIGFTFSRINYPNIISKPVFRELMYLVCHKDNHYHDQISCEELSADHEVYLNWGPDYYQWHLQHWPEDKYPLVTVNTGNLLQHFLHEERRWAIAPMSVIQALEGKDITFYTIKESPPPRICYELTNRYPNFSHVQAIALFEEELQKYIMNSDSVCAFEEWMLNDR